MDDDDDFTQPEKRWDAVPPYWDQKLGKRLKGNWTFYFIQVSADGGETYHAFEPRKFSVLRVGCLDGVIEQTATWDRLPTRTINPATPPGVGWKVHRMGCGFHYWRRPALIVFDPMPAKLSA